MKAVVIDGYGDQVVPRVADMPKPSPGKGRVLVRIAAASVNPIDWKVAQGYFSLVSGRKFPLVLGSDLAGVVEAVGAGVNGFAPGDEVFGMGASGVGHTFADFAAVSANAIGRKPARIDFAGAASVALVGATVLAALKGKSAPAPGKRIFISGGSGGVGSFAVQFCKSEGAEVIATCSERNLQFVRDLGADEVIDYNAHDPAGQLRDIDVIFDTIGTLDPDRYWSVVRRGGAILSTGTGPRGMHELADRHGRRWWLLAGGVDGMKQMLRGRFRHGVSYVMAFAVPTADKMRRIADLLDTGKVKPIVAGTYPFEQAAQAFARSQTGRVRGKLVLIPGQGGSSA